MMPATSDLILNTLPFPAVRVNIVERVGSELQTGDSISTVID